MIGKIAALSLAIIYIIATWVLYNGESAFKLGVYLIFPVSCIMWSEPLGNYVGMFGRHPITHKTPSFIVALGGWILLLLPLFAWIYLEASR